MPRAGTGPRGERGRLRQWFAFREKVGPIRGGAQRPVCVACRQVRKANVPSLRLEKPLTKNRQFVKSTSAEVCFQCHLQRRAQLQRSSHAPFREGRVTCTIAVSCTAHSRPSCRPKARLTRIATSVMRSGPFLREHSPVMENCVNCHDARGSSRPQLLKASMPRLCRQCHVVNRHNSTPTQATIGRQVICSLPTANAPVFGY